MKLTNFLVPTSSPHLSRPSLVLRSGSASTSPAVSEPASRALSVASSHAVLITPLLAISEPTLRVLSVASSCGPSIAPSPDASHPPSSHCPSPVESSKNEDESDGNEDIAVSDGEPDSGEHNSMISSDNEDNEEDNIDNVMEASGSQLKAKEEIRRWEEL
jgi:hypothetical protein